VATCGGVVAAPLMREMGLETVELYIEMDGRFQSPSGSHGRREHARPAGRREEKRAQIGMRMTATPIGLARSMSTGASSGRRTDGGVCAVDSKGTPRARRLSATSNVRSGCTTISRGMVTADHVEDGHSLIKSKLKQEHAALAGEMSGHMFFNDRYYGFDDAIYSSFRLLEILGREVRTGRKLLADLPQTCFTRSSGSIAPTIESSKLCAGPRNIFRRITTHRYRWRTCELSRRMGPGACVQYAARARDALRGTRPADARRDSRAVRR